MSEYFYVTLLLNGMTLMKYQDQRFVVYCNDLKDLEQWSKKFNGAFPWIMYELESGEKP